VVIRDGEEEMATRVTGAPGFRFLISKQWVKLQADTYKTYKSDELKP